MNARCQTKGIRILVVDEDYDLVHSLARLLRFNGFLVDEATAGVEAVNLAREHCPRLVLLEYSLHDLSGMEACDRIQETCPRATLILTVATENEFLEVRESGLPAFRKPFELAELLPTLDALADDGDNQLNLPS